jgi:nucleoside-diphosphate-sugar epimerase
MPAAAGEDADSLGSHLVPQSVAPGHEVTGMARSPARIDAVRALGARPVVADALDPDAVGRAVAEAENTLAATAARM